MVDIRRLTSILFLLSFVLLTAFLGCGSDPKGEIKRLGGSKEERDEAMLRLVLSKNYAIPPLIEALSDENTPPNIRSDVVEILYRLSFREHDPRIEKTLLMHVDDEDPKIREGIVKAFGRLKTEEATDVLMDRLTDEESEVRYQALLALRSQGGWEIKNRVIVGGEHMTDEQRQRLTEATKELSKDKDERVRHEAVEFVERIAQQIIDEGNKLSLGADLAGAEQKYREALELVPNSKNANWVLGMFYIDNEDEQKGMDILREHGMLAYARRLSVPPIVDGDIGDACWKEAERVTDFYKLITKVSSVPTDGKTEAFIGYTHDKLYIAFKGYEDSTEYLTLKYKERENKTWEDDCIQVHLDINRDKRTYHHIIINAIGTIWDAYREPSANLLDTSWNGNYDLATKIEEKFWTLELGIPFEDLEGAKVGKGTVWRINLVRVRIEDSEYCEWIPEAGGLYQRPQRLGLLVFD